MGFPEVNEMNFGGSRNGGCSVTTGGLFFSDFTIPPPSAPPFTQGRLCVKRVVRTHSVGEDTILPCANFDLWVRLYFRARFYRSPSRTQSVILEQGDRISAGFPPE